MVIKHLYFLEVDHQMVKVRVSKRNGKMLMIGLEMSSLRMGLKSTIRKQLIHLVKKVKRIELS